MANVNKRLDQTILNYGSIGDPNGVGGIDMKANRLPNQADPVEDQDGVTLNYANNNFAPLTSTIPGGTISTIANFLADRTLATFFNSLGEEIVSIIWNTSNKLIGFIVHSSSVDFVSFNQSANVVFMGSPIVTPAQGAFAPVVDTTYYFTPTGAADPALAFTDLSQGGTFNLALSTDNIIYTVTIPNALISGTSPITDAWLSAKITFEELLKGNTFTLPAAVSGNLTSGNFDFSFGSRGNTTDTGIVAFFDGQITHLTISEAISIATPAPPGQIQITINGIGVGPIFDFTTSQSVIFTLSPTEIISFTKQKDTINIQSVNTTTDYTAINVLIQGIIIN